MKYGCAKALCKLALFCYAERMAEEDWEPGNPWIYNKIFDIADRILDSHESANVFIILLVVLLILPLLGMGILLTRVAAPPVPQQIETQQ